MFGRGFIIACFSLVSACGAETHQSELRQLERSVETLQSQIAHQDARLEALSNRFVMLANKAEKQPQVSVQPLLDVVKLEPEETESAEALIAEAEIEEPPIVLT